MTVAGKHPLIVAESEEKSSLAPDMARRMAVGRLVGRSQETPAFRRSLAEAVTVAPSVDGGRFQEVGEGELLFGERQAALLFGPTLDIGPQAVNPAAGGQVLVNQLSQWFGQP